VIPMAPQETTAKRSNIEMTNTVSHNDRTKSSSSGTEAGGGKGERKLVSKYVPSEEKFPYFELSVLFFASFTSAIPLVGLFPYVAFMVVDLGAADSIDEAGYVSGYLATSFMAGRIISSFYWGHVADKAGRLPVALISCASIIVFSLAFGLSVNLWMAIITRFALGVMNPLNTLTKTLISDICCKKHQPMGMSLASGSWSVGLVIGPALGGWLARPCVQYPKYFAGVWLFETFPYLLPNLVTVAMTLVSITLIWFYLPETAPVYEVRTRHAANNICDDIESRNSDESSREVVEELVDVRPSLLSVLCMSSTKTSDEDSSTEDQSSHKETNNLLVNAFNLFMIPKVMRVCVAYFMISVTAIIFDEVFPLWAQASIGSGGLSMTGATVGQIGSVTGIPMLFTTFFIFPLVTKKFGCVWCFRIAQLLSASFTLSVACVPFALSTLHLPDSWLVPVLMVLSSGSRCCAVVAFSSVFVLTNNSVGASQRGAVNGLSMTLGGVAKAVGPLAGSVIFAWSINNGVHRPPFNFMCIFIITLCIGIGTCFLQFDEDVNPGAESVDTSDSNGKDRLNDATSSHGLMNKFTIDGDEDEENEEEKQLEKDQNDSDTVTIELSSVSQAQPGSKYVPLSTTDSPIHDESREQ
jgi:MFS family permease